jgi:hypothetical protein
VLSAGVLFEYMFVGRESRRLPEPNSTGAGSWWLGNRRRVLDSCSQRAIGCERQ